MIKKTIILIIVFLLAVLFLTTKPKTAAVEQKIVFVNDHKIIAEVADTPAEREKGLSGRTSLELGHGLLFIFDEPGYYGFWMKEMNFPIDILWLDDNFTIVDSWLNADPSSYPEVFTPKNKTRYVLETNPGEIATD